MTSAATITDNATVCHAMRLGGRVQGVGFRPFVYQLALRYQLYGEVRNSGGEVWITVQGAPDNIASFAQALIAEAPAISRPQLLQDKAVGLISERAFQIVESTIGSDPHIHVPPDYYTCAACRAELTDSQNRRYGYPFINCTQCGPRYTLIEAMPYDRANTSMASFTLCQQCQREYQDVADRRFHAEPLACPVCGPQLSYQHADMRITATQQALAATVVAIDAGEIIAIRGIGGYHLCCDAHNVNAIAALRARKSRPHKPLALMFPENGDDGLAMVRQHLALEQVQCDMLRGPARPIVLATRRADSSLPASIAPGLEQLGVMLPYSPLHHLLLDKLQRPIVATSANISGEPVLTDNTQVEQRLGKITQHFLHHNRPIVRPADDSVYRVIAQQPRPIRLGRGVAPLELTLPIAIKQPVLACGGHMKNTVALAFDRRIVISPHIGDMGSVRSQQVFAQVIADLQALYQVEAAGYVCDAHPHYASSRWARQQGKPVFEVLHHHAHAACLPGEYPHEEHWLVFTWDGVGYGADGTLWGGETFYGQAGHWQRVASLRPFHLPGGDKAAREPWRSALAISWEMDRPWPDCPVDQKLLHAAWLKRLNTPQTTAVGRVFDAAAALLDICHIASFEGQAPMLLEALARQGKAQAVSLLLSENPQGLLCTDWAPLFARLHDEAMPTVDAAYAVHVSLAQALCDQVTRMHERYGDFAVGLCGGVFQNKLLTELLLERLQCAGYRAYLPQQVPVNDGGLCFGQVIEAAAMLDIHDA